MLSRGSRARGMVNMGQKLFLPSRGTDHGTASGGGHGSRGVVGRRPSVQESLQGCISDGALCDVLERLLPATWRSVCVGTTMMLCGSMLSADGLAQVMATICQVQSAGDLAPPRISWRFIRRLELSSCRISAAELRAVTSVMAVDPWIEALDLSGNPLSTAAARQGGAGTDDGVVELVAAILANPRSRLRVLSLRSTGIGAEATRAMRLLASSHPHLSSLDLRANSGGVEGAYACVRLYLASWVQWHTHHHSLVYMTAELPVPRYRTRDPSGR